ncbi:helix-turn-helix domain-containing protein [Streptomyces sp. NPDC004134]|uniref:helix-turn-helix domain-containing protein n=1 Tax=Streptomyces sp. NPDC004134 TaxID=3364691 RepID=UPI0036A04887
MIHEEDGLPGQRPVQPESPRAPRPGQLRTRAEYLAALRELRTWSGLTYRELEAKAGTHADSLPASTIATTLGRTTLPRERFVDAFTRACGLAEQDVGPWLEARRRIATHEQAGPPPGKDDDTEPEPPPAGPVPRWRRAAALLAAVGIGAGGALGVQALLSEPSGPGEPRAAVGNHAVPGLGLKAVGSWAEIRPSRSPEFCVTEGTDRTGRYRTAVAAQRPCAEAALPRVYLEPVGEGAVQIQWHHPEHGIGCLTAMREGPGRGLLEPREACADDDPAQRFRLEAAGQGADRRFRIRPGGGGCLAPRDEDTAPGAAMAQTRCSDAAEQEFTISLTPPP